MKTSNPKRRSPVQSVSENNETKKAKIDASPSTVTNKKSADGTLITPKTTNIRQTRSTVKNEQVLPGAQVSTEPKNLDPKLTSVKKDSINTTVAKTFEKLFYCRVCKNRFDLDSYIPRFVPCGQTVCNECLKFVNKPNFKCPSCSATHDYPSDGFKTNTIIFEFLSDHPCLNEKEKILKQACVKLNEIEEKYSEEKYDSIAETVNNFKLETIKLYETTIENLQSRMDGFKSETEKFLSKKNKYFSKINEFIVEKRKSIEEIKKKVNDSNSGIKMEDLKEFAEKISKFYDSAKSLEEKLASDINSFISKNKFNDFKINEKAEDASVLLSPVSGNGSENEKENENEPCVFSNTDKSEISFNFNENCDCLVPIDQDTFLIGTQKDVLSMFKIVDRNMNILDELIVNNELDFVDFYVDNDHFYVNFAEKQMPNGVLIRIFEKKFEKNLCFIKKQILYANANEVLISSKRKDDIHVINYELKKINAFGQCQDESIPFYFDKLNYKIVGCNDYKIIIVDNQSNFIKVMCRESGKCLVGIELGSNDIKEIRCDKNLRIYVLNKEKSMRIYNDYGSLISNKSIDFPDQFDQYLVINKDLIAFLNYKMKSVKFFKI